MFDKCGSTSCLFHCLITGCANPSIDSVQLNLNLLFPTLNPFPLAGKICGLFFPHSSFSSALPSPSPPSSGQVSRECCSKGCTRGCICLAFLHCVLSNESSNVQMLLMTLLNAWRVWNWTKNGSLTIQSLNCLCSH